MKDLSQERFSLLTEDQKIDYIRERSIFDDDLSKAKRNGEIFEKLDNLFSFDSKDYEELINETFYDVFGKDLRKTLGTEEYKKMILEVANQEKINQIMNINEEYPGVDAGPKSLGWLLGLATSGLALLGILIGKLLSAGKQQIAIVMLRRYMKKLVELIDNGANKKKTLLKGVVQRLAGVGTKYNGQEDNRTCFRTIQKYNERNFCNYTAKAAKCAGLLSGDGSTTKMGGLTYFKDNFIDPFLNKSE